MEVISVGVVCALSVLFSLFPVPGADGDNILSPTRILQGFANPALITVLALLVMGQGMVRTGVLDRGARWILSAAGGRGMAVHCRRFRRRPDHQRVPQQHSRGRHLHSRHAHPGGALRHLGQQGDDPAQLRRRARRHDHAGRFGHQPSRQQRPDRVGPDAVRFLRLHRARPDDGRRRARLCAARRAPAAARPCLDGSRAAGARRQAVHRPDRGRLRLAPGRRDGAGRSVPGAARRDGAHGAARRAGRPAAVRGAGDPPRRSAGGRRDPQGADRNARTLPRFDAQR